MSWEVTVRLRGQTHVRVEVDPLPSQLAQVLLVVEPGRCTSARRRLERIFQRVSVDRATGRRSWVPIPLPRAVGWRSVVMPRGEWWICGPLAHAGESFARAIALLHGRTIAARMRRRALVIVDARTGAELGPEVPRPILVHLPDLVPGGEDDDARAA